MVFTYEKVRMGMALLSIVLPSYNEEQNIANTANVLAQLLEKERIDYELVFSRKSNDHDKVYVKIR